jgi:hypothetical protein
VLSYIELILEAVFCEAVQHLLRFCLNYLNCVKMAAFQRKAAGGQVRRVEWVGTVMLFFVSSSLVKKRV